MTASDELSLHPTRNQASNNSLATCARGTSSLLHPLCLRDRDMGTSYEGYEGSRGRAVEEEEWVLCDFTSHDHLEY